MEIGGGEVGTEAPGLNYVGWPIDDGPLACGCIKNDEAQIGTVVSAKGPGVSGQVRVCRIPGGVSRIQDDRGHIGILPELGPEANGAVREVLDPGKVGHANVRTDRVGALDISNRPVGMPEGAGGAEDAVGGGNPIGGAETPTVVAVSGDIGHFAVGEILIEVEMQFQTGVSTR